MNSKFSRLLVLAASALGLCAASPALQAASLGQNPAAGLTVGSDGSLYGTTSNGGTNNLGTVYRIDPNGYFSTLVNFSGTVGSQLGATPLSSLIFGADGNLYGTTSEGGASNVGTVFKTSISGSLQTLLSFAGPTSDGATPQGRLVQGNDKNFYGLTSQGGTTTPGDGAVFRITPNGTEVLLNAFGGGNGAYPNGGLIQGRNGNFYGVTFAGGANGLGTIFSVDPTGNLVDLYDFTGSATDGSNPLGELVEDPATNGLFYGTASNGGASGYGTVYSFNLNPTPPATAFTTIASFSGSIPAATSTGSATPPGANPHTGLIVGSDGNLYGTTFAGGTSSLNLGTVFRINRIAGLATPPGTVTVDTLGSFTGANGAGPDGTLVEKPAGTFLGTTYSGGQGTSGTIFKITPPAGIVTVQDFAFPNQQGPPVITSATSASINPNTTFSYQITATNTPTSYNANGLPSGLSINTTTGLISGTVPSSGNFTFTISATNATGTGTAGFSLIVVPSAPTIVSTTTTTGQEGVAFSYQIVATNEPTSFTATGLPQGLAIDQTTGIISGTSTISGEFNVILTASNNSGTGSATLALTMDQPTPTISGTTGGGGGGGGGTITKTVRRNAFFTYQIVATNNPTNYDAFILPPGVTIDNATGVISGTPTIEGTYNFTVAATNDGGTGSANFTLSVIPPAPVINSPSTDTAVVNVTYAYQITTVEPIITPANLDPNGTKPSPFIAYGVPPGLKLDEGAGVISGTPTFAGVYKVVLEAGSSGGIGTQVLTLTILPPPPTITSGATLSGVVGQAISYNIEASGTPTSYNASGLPPGLTVNSVTGVISGTPTTAGTYNATISASNASGTGTSGLAITISAPSSTTVTPTPTVSPTATPTGSATPTPTPTATPVTVNTLQFSSAAYTVASQSGSVSVPVTLSRVSGDTSTVMVSFTTMNGSAAAGTDYTATSGTFTYGVNDTTATIVIPITARSAGSSSTKFTVNIYNPVNASLGTIASAVVTITNPDLSTKLMNVSTRGPVETGDNVMIAGLIIQGSDSKQVVLRGIGPSLTASGVVNAIADPTLTLLDSNGNQLAYNDDYGQLDTADQQTLASNNLTPGSSTESAIVATLAPGTYTAILRGKTDGIAMVEAYDVSGTANAHFANISTRGKVEVPENGDMIAGFIVGAPSSSSAGTAQKVLIRALGPSLTGKGVTDALADTTLDIYRGSTLILSNDNWMTAINTDGSSNGSQQAAIQSTGLAPTNAKEAAILATLDPGSYTAVVRGKGGTTGVALVEVYQLP